MARMSICSHGCALSTFLAVTTLAAAAVAGLFNTVLFVGPPTRTQPPTNSQTSTAVVDTHGHNPIVVEAARVEALRLAAIEACFIAEEGDASALETCRELSYELAIEEQLLLRRQGNMRYLDNDSY